MGSRYFFTERVVVLVLPIFFWWRMTPNFTGNRGPDSFITKRVFLFSRLFFFWSMNVPLTTPLKKHWVIVCIYIYLFDYLYYTYHFEPWQWCSKKSTQPKKGTFFLSLPQTTFFLNQKHHRQEFPLKRSNAATDNDRREIPMPVPPMSMATVVLAPDCLGWGVEASWGFGWFPEIPQRVVKW